MQAMRPIDLSILAITVVALLSTDSLLAQNAGSPWPVRTELSSPNAAEVDGNFGRRVASLSDFDGDGQTEILAGPWDDAGLTTFGVFSSIDGSILRSHAFDSAGLAFFSDFIAQVGDLDLDGTPDYAICASRTEVAGVLRTGSVYIYSGATGTQLLRIDGTLVDQELGTGIVDVGDVNADGTPDLAIAANGAHDGVYVCSGADGTTLYSIPPPLDAGWYGHVIGSIQDLNADGNAEILVGAPVSDVGGVDRSGFVEIYSGADGSFLRRHVGEGIKHYFGWALCTVADLDGDGFEEYFIGARRAFGSWGAAYLYSGKDGALIRRFDGNSGGFLGDQVADAGDLDGDGLTDLLVGCTSAYGSEGEFWAISGATGAVLSRIRVEPGYTNLGKVVLGVGDRDGDGRADVLVSDSLAGGPGRIRLFTGFDSELTASANSISMSAGGTVQFDIDFPSSKAGRSYRLFGSPRWGIIEARGMAFAIGDHSLIFSTLQSGFIPWTIGHTGVLDAAGNATALTVVPPGSGSLFIGETIYVAAILMPLPRVATRGTSAVAIEILP